MKTEDELTYISEHVSCPINMHNIEEGFVLKDIPRGQIYIKKEVSSKNNIVALLSGSIEMKYEQDPPRIISEGEMFSLSRSSVIDLRCIENSRIMILFFEVPKINCEKLNFQELKEIDRNLQSEFNVLPIKPTLKLLFSSLTNYLEIGMNCQHLHAIKQDEMWLCLRCLYSKKELAMLFASMLHTKNDFRHLILDNYERVTSVQELVELTHMSKSVFFEKFKKEFGISAKQWVLAKRAQKIEHMALKPDMTVKKLMAAFDFDSLSSLQRFCKKHMKCSPTVLINRKSSSKVELFDLTPIVGEHKA